MIRFIIYLLQIYAILQRDVPKAGKGSAVSVVGASFGSDADMCVILSGGRYLPQSNLARINPAIHQKRSGLGLGHL